MPGAFIVPEGAAATARRIVAGELPLIAWLLFKGARTPAVATRTA